MFLTLPDWGDHCCRTSEIGVGILWRSTIRPLAVAEEVSADATAAHRLHRHPTRSAKKAPQVVGLDWGAVAEFSGNSVLGPECFPLSRAEQ